MEEGGREGGVEGGREGGKRNDALLLLSTLKKGVLSILNCDLILDATLLAVPRQNLIMIQHGGSPRFIWRRGAGGHTFYNVAVCVCTIK